MGYLLVLLLMMLGFGEKCITWVRYPGYAHQKSAVNDF